jgi:tetratricopeptide (TPR) repeat protein
LAAALLPVIIAPSTTLMPSWNSQTTHIDSGNFSDNPELKRQLKMRRIKIATSVVVLLLLLAVSAKPVYRAVREVIVNRNLEAAREAARIEDWSEARDKARSVLIARPGDFEAFRLWTRALGKIEEPRAYLAAAQLFGDPRATTEDKLDCLRVLAMQAPQAVALGAFASLPAEEMNQPTFRAAISPLYVKRGSVDIAEVGLREVMGEDDPPVLSLELLRVLCVRPSEARVSEAREILADLIRKSAAAEALEGLLILADAPGGLSAGKPLPDLPLWVDSQPQAKTIHHLMALHPSLDGLPAADQSLFKAAIERFGGIDPGVVGTWLVRHGQAELALELLRDVAQTRSDAYLALLHAQLRLGRMEELDKALETPPASADAVEIEVVRATLAVRRGDESAAAGAWNRALNQAAFDNSSNRFIEIADAAEAAGSGAALLDAWVAAILSAWGQLPLAKDLETVMIELAKRGRSEDLLDVSRSLLRYEPNNPKLVNNSQYLGMIHGLVTPEDASRALQHALEAHPEMPELQSAMMMARLMAGQGAEALKLLPAVRQCRKISPMMLNALEGSALVLEGRNEEGLRLLGRVRWGLFLRQERVAFRDILIKLKIEGLPLPEFEEVVVEDPSQSRAWRKALDERQKAMEEEVLPALPAPAQPAIELE